MVYAFMSHEGPGIQIRRYFPPYAALLLPAAMIVVTAGRINMLGDPTREAAAK